VRRSCRDFVRKEFRIGFLKFSGFVSVGGKLLLSAEKLGLDQLFGMAGNSL